MRRVLLEITDLSCSYGPVRAVRGVSFEVAEGAVACILGANGAGKSTTLKAVSGLVRPAAGIVRFDGRDITHLPAHRRVALGIAHCPEGRRIFANLSVADNLRLGGHRLSRADLSAAQNRVLEIFPRLAQLLDRRGGLLSGGEQQMLAIARAIMIEPRLLLLDEPTLGLAPLICEQVFESLAAINRRGTTILLVEQNAMTALAFASYGLVLVNGAVDLKGAAAELRDTDRVRRAYLGG
ncbi:MAG: ABC transporter ATP-binding protein [Mycobacteriales bacterium]